MTKIAFLGLGQMGTPMASRLLAAGHQTVVWDRTPERAKPLLDGGATWAGSPAEAGAGADFAITMLATPEALRQVLLGEDGLGRSLHPRQVYIDMSTVGPETVRSISGELPEGVAMVDAPVRGSVPQATEGRLEIFVGATDAEFELVRPILDVLGTPRHVGGHGAGAAMKLIANLALGVSIAAVGEALSIGQSLGLSQGSLLDMLENSQFGPAVRAKRSNIESGQFEPNFKLRHAEKDLRLVIEAATAAKLDLKVTSAAKEWFDEAAEGGAADLDFSAVVAKITGQATNT